MSLRGYQIDVLERLAAMYAGGARSVLLQLPTGGGKTHVAAELVRRAALERGRRVLFLAHLDLLLTDTSRRLAAVGLEHDVIQAGERGHGAAVAVASLATLHRRGERPPADFIILDECRRAQAPTVRAILEAYPGAKLLGLDATPQRGDGAPLGDIFEAMVEGPSIRELTAAGWLVPAKVLAPLSIVQPGALSMDPVEAIKAYAQGRRTLVFARDLNHADELAARLEDLGLDARVLSGDSSADQRDAARLDLHRHRLDVVINVDVFKEGADVPSVDCVVLARGCSVASTYLQQVGRGLRPSPDTHKSDCLVLDLSGASLEHGLPDDPRRWSLTGTATQRFDEGLVQLARCKECFAIFHAGPSACPRCGVSTRGTREKRRATRIERQAIARLDTRPGWLRDEIAIKAIANRLRRSGRFKSEAQINAIAKSVFIKQKGRAPTAKTG